MENSILKTIRNMIGPSASYEVFDVDLIIHINSAFSRLCQLGVGPLKPFRIHSEEEQWSDFMAGCSSAGVIDDVKEYIFISVRLIFDPPESSMVMNAYKERLDMLEWTMKEVARHGY